MDLMNDVKKDGVISQLVRKVSVIEEWIRNHKIVNHIPYEAGTWTPVDSSGAGLVLTVRSATYVKVGTMITAWLDISFPVTASGANAQIGGLPYAAGAYSGNSISGFIAATNTAINYGGLYNGAGATSFFIDKNSGTAVATNADMSQCILYAVLIYHT